MSLWLGNLTAFPIDSYPLFVYDKISEQSDYSEIYPNTIFLPFWILVYVFFYCMSFFFHISWYDISWWMGIKRGMISLLRYPTWCSKCAVTKGKLWDYQAVSICQLVGEKHCYVVTLNNSCGLCVVVASGRITTKCSSFYRLMHFYQGTENIFWSPGSFLHPVTNERPWDVSESAGSETRLFFSKQHAEYYLNKTKTQSLKRTLSLSSSKTKILYAVGSSWKRDEKPRLQLCLQVFAVNSLGWYLAKPVPDKYLRFPTEVTCKTRSALTWREFQWPSYNPCSQM